MKSSLGKLAMLSALMLAADNTYPISNPYSDVESGIRRVSIPRVRTARKQSAMSQRKRRKLGRQNPHFKYAN